jgi:hypothetical protein
VMQVREASVGDEAIIAELYVASRSAACVDSWTRHISMGSTSRKKAVTCARVLRRVMVGGAFWWVWRTSR